jgi:hypothetical protein
VYESPAFYIQNNDTVEHDATLSFEFDSYINGARAYFQVQDEDLGTSPAAGPGNTNGELSGEMLAEDGSKVSTTLSLTQPQPGSLPSDASDGLSSGEKAGVSFALSTVRCTNTGDLSGTLSISVN